MKTTIQSTPAYELTASIRQIDQGHHLSFTLVVPTARRPEEQVKFQVTLDRAGLLALRDLIDGEVASCR